LLIDHRLDVGPIDELESFHCPKLRFEEFARSLCDRTGSGNHRAYRLSRQRPG